MRAPPSGSGRLVVARAPFLALVAGLVTATSCDDGAAPAAKVPSPAPEAGPAPPVPESDAEAPPGDDDDAEANEDAGAGRCDDEGELRPSCDAFGTSSAPGCDRATCDRYRSRYKARAARRAITCMMERIKNGTSCDPCAAKALENACPDDMAKELCQKLARVCKRDAGDLTDCTRLTTPLSFGGRETFLTCSTDESCKFPLSKCGP